MTTTYTITDAVTGETKPLHLLSQKEMDALFKTWAEDLREEEDQCQARHTQPISERKAIPE